MLLESVLVLWLVLIVELSSDRGNISSDSSVRVYNDGAALYLGRLTLALKNPSGGGVFRYLFNDCSGGVSNRVGAV